MKKKYSEIEQQILTLSKDKWLWMADKNVKKLAPLFDDKSKFVHMSGTWKKDQELEIIKTGSIWYKEAKIHDTAIELLEKQLLFGIELHWMQLSVVVLL